MKTFDVSEAACFTGHRRIPPSLMPEIRGALRRAILDVRESGIRYFLCGGALGFDTAAAQEVLALRSSSCPDIRLVMVLPCVGQDRYWNAGQRAVYSRIISDADDKIFLSDHYFPGCMQNRNRYMVDHSSLCICLWSGTSGGTSYTVGYAASNENIRLINLADRLSDVSLFYGES